MENVNNVENTTKKNKPKNKPIDFNKLDFNKLDEIEERVLKAPKRETENQKILDLLQEKLLKWLSPKAQGGDELPYNKVSVMIEEWSGKKISKQAISLYAQKHLNIKRESRRYKNKDTQSGPNTDN